MLPWNHMSIFDYFKLAETYAQSATGCCKIAVGSVIVRNGVVLALGANRAVPDLCRARGCLRQEKYGDDSKAHRNPEDCRAIHSEIDAISNAARAGVALEGSMLFVTRYPCENCAKAIIAAGISVVYYSGSAKISSATTELFDSAKVTAIHVPDFGGDSNDH